MIAWIKEHKLISVLVLIIVVTLTLLVSSVASSGSGNFVTRGITNVTNFFVKPVARVGNALSDNAEGIFSYRSIMKENKELKKENEKLRKQVINLTLSDNQLKELEELSGLLNYKEAISEKEIVSCDVVAFDGTNWMNNFTINRGSESGIKVGDTVVAGEGLVGEIQDTGKGWSKVVTIVDRSNSISFKLKGNLDFIGIINESKAGRLMGFMLDGNVKIENGEQVITSGMGKLPEGIDIGTISKNKYDKDRHMLTVVIKPSVDFTSIQKVSVIL